MTLVPVDLSACPDCGGPLYRFNETSPAMFRTGGYGASRLATRLLCLRPVDECGWQIQLSTQEVRP